VSPDDKPFERPFGYYPHSTLKPEMLSHARRELVDYTISLVLNLKPVGSGTLINVAGVDGILTAHHVSQIVFEGKEKDLGINCANYYHHLSVPISHLKHFVIGACDENTARVGPDLAFIQILDPRVLGTLRSKKSFFHLDKRKEVFDWLQSLPIRQLYRAMNWFIGGAPQEFSKSFTAQGEPILKESHFVGEATFLSITTRLEFDYVRLRLTAGYHNFPGQYKGVSGGGIWLVPFTMDPDKGQQTARYIPFLAGVVYIQSATQHHGRIITGHGPSSLYTTLVRHLREKH